MGTTTKVYRSMGDLPEDVLMLAAACQDSIGPLVEFVDYASTPWQQLTGRRVFYNREFGGEEVQNDHEYENDGLTKTDGLEYRLVWFWRFEDLDPNAVIPPAFGQVWHGHASSGLSLTLCVRMRKRDRKVMDSLVTTQVHGCDLEVHAFRPLVERGHAIKADPHVMAKVAKQIESVCECLNDVSQAREFLKKRALVRENDQGLPLVQIGEQLVPFPKGTIVAPAALAPTKDENDAAAEYYGKTV